MESLLTVLMGMKEQVMVQPALPPEVAEVSSMTLAMEMDEYMASLKKAIDAGVQAEEHLTKCCIEFCIHGLIKMPGNFTMTQRLALKQQYPMLNRGLPR